MGSPFAEATWNGVEGAYYAGAGGTWEPIWLFASMGLCALALIVGIAHEQASYRRVKREQHDQY